MSWLGVESHGGLRHVRSFTIRVPSGIWPDKRDFDLEVLKHFTDNWGEGPDWLELAQGWGRTALMW
jgi:hypothetical protein